MPPSPPPSRGATVLLALVGGLLADAAFPQRGWWPMAILALGALFLALRRESAWWGLVVGTVWGLPFFLIHIWWAGVAVGLVPWIALSAVQALAVGLFGATWVWMRRWSPVARHAWLSTLVFALNWAAWEELRSAGPFGGFPWGRLAFSQTDSPLLRLASLGGTVLVSSVVAAMGACLALAILALGRAKIATASVAVVAVVALPALSLMVPLDTRPQAGEVRVGVVQGNVSRPGLGAFENAREVITNHTNATLELAATNPGLDVVLWPENAADYDPRTDAEASAMVESAAQAVGVPILLGTQSYLRDAAGTATGRYNDYIRWDPGVGAVASYAKRHPAPFAEYIPFREFFRRFSSAVDLVTVDMLPGTEVGVIPVPVDGRDVPFGIATCFEVAYDEIARDAVQAGAEVLVVPTNNASFGYTAESEQQLAMSIFRAVEHGRAVVQVSTVGVSGIITPNGVVTERTELFTTASMVADLPLRTELTLATRLGPIPAWITYGVSGLALLLGFALHGRGAGASQRRDGTNEGGRGRERKRVAA